MRARTAYISSFATTGILVASSLLMLAMLSAIVAFHRWPQGSGGSSVDPVGISAGSSVTGPSLPVDHPARAQVASTRVRASATAARAGVAHGHSDGVVARQGETARGPSTISPAPSGPVRQAPAAPVPQSSPGLPPSRPVPPRPPYPGPPGGPIDAVTGTLTGAIDPISPAGSSTVGGIAQLAQAATGGGLGVAQLVH